MTLILKGDPLNEWLDQLELKTGSHTSPEAGMCILEAVAWVTGSDFNDTPECVSPVIRAFAMSWNDSLRDEDRNRLLKPIMLDLVGTNTGNFKVESELAWMATDWLVRTHTPVWLRLAGLTVQAEQLESLPELNPETTPPILPTLKAVRTDAAAARDAAGDAARAAAGAAAWDAAGDAAWDAARAAARAAAGAAAGDAAWDAARGAAWDAAWAAAWDAAGAAARAAAGAAAGAAAWDAARDAARGAAWDAAWAAARGAAWDVLRPSVVNLQTSAAELLTRMANHAKAYNAESAKPIPPIRKSTEHD